MSESPTERRFVQLRPASHNSEKITKALEQHGYRQVPSPRGSQQLPPSSQPRASQIPSPQSPQKPSSSLQRAIRDFQNHENPAMRQLALKHITNHATNPNNHQEIISGILPQLVEAISSVDEVNQKLAVMTLSNLARTGRYFSVLQKSYPIFIQILSRTLSSNNWKIWCGCQITLIDPKCFQ